MQVKAGAAILISVLCLQLGISKAQDDANVWEPIAFSLNFPKTAKPNEEVAITLKLETDLKECMVIKTLLRGQPEITDGSFNYIQKRCLCNDYPATFIWDFSTNKTTRIATMVYIIKEKGICPEDRAVVPILDDWYYSINTLSIQ